ncbi:MAG: hypothetical protein EA391_03725 [Balneolaceae bacterium]|nr:MAG: hypothetical protein EA391_03725 [Balneolaceae bacterium]
MIRISEVNRLPAVGVFITIIAFLLISCGTESNDIDETDGFRDGILNEIWELLDEGMISSLENDLGMPIHRGANPPDFSAFFDEEMRGDGVTFEMAPHLLHRSTVESDQGNNEPGTPWAPRAFRFSNQNLQNYTINFATRASQTDDNTVAANGSYIIGFDNHFTMFAFLENVRGEGVVKSLRMFSGILTDQGVSEPYTSTFMIDNSGIRGVIPNGTGRSFVDGDDFAEIIPWPEGNSMSIENQVYTDLENEIYK